MQLFVRQAGAQRTVVVEAHPHDCFELIAERLASTATATSSAEVVSCQSTCMLPLRTVLRPSPVLSRDSLQTFEFKGRTYPQGTSLASAGVQSGDFIALYQRLRGGGGDGGSTGAESRSSFLEMYATKKAAKVTLLIVQNGVCARQHFQTWSCRSTLLRPNWRNGHNAIYQGRPCSRPVWLMNLATYTTRTPWYRRL